MKSTIRQAVIRCAISHGMIGVAALAVVAAGPAAGASFDCAKAGTAQEKLICATPELSKLDEAVAAAYAQVMGKLAEPVRTAMRDSQRDWVRYRQAACPVTAKPSPDAVLSPAECISSLYQNRQKALAEALTTVGPYSFVTLERFRAEKTKDEDTRARFPVYSTTTATPRLVAPAGPEADAFNAEMKTWTDAYFAPPDPKKPKEDGDMDTDTDFSGSVVFNYAGPTLISLQQMNYLYGLGAAHGMMGATSVTWLWREKRAMKADDLFKPGSNWQPALARMVLDELHKKDLAKDEPFQIKDPKDIRQTTDDPRNWIIEPGSFGVQFGQYEVASYAEGMPVIELPWSALKPYLVANPPLTLE